MAPTKRPAVFRRALRLLACASACVAVGAFSPVRTFLARGRRDAAASGGPALGMAGFPPPMGGAGGRGGPPPPMGGGGFPPPMGGGARPRGAGAGGGRPYSADNPPGGPFGVPNAGNTAGEPRSRPQDPDARGLGAIASGVSTPMDRYGDVRPRRPGGYDGSSRGSIRDGGSVREDPGGSSPPDSRFGDNWGDMRGETGSVGGGRPQNLRYEERDYGEYVTALRSSDGGRRRRGPTGARELEEEVERLRKENALLKRSCQDLMNNFNELSNRLFDVDESLKKVAKVFPSEEEMESLEWLLRR